MRKVRFVGLLFTFLLLVGCSFWSDPVQDDLLNYINNELDALVELEEEAVSEYESVVGDNYIDDWTTYFHIEEVVIPKYRHFVDKLESIRPATKEVREVHEIYIEAVNKQQNAMVKILAGIEAQNLELIFDANELLDEGRAGIRKFINEIEELADNHNVVLD